MIYYCINAPYDYCNIKKFIYSGLITSPIPKKGEKITPKNIALIIGAVLLVGVLYYWWNSSPKRTYARAARMHQKGESYYLEGDQELAAEYYQESEKLREKARGLA